MTFLDELARLVVATEGRAVPTVSLLLSPHLRYRLLLEANSVVHATNASVVLKHFHLSAPFFDVGAEGVCRLPVSIEMQVVVLVSITQRFHYA